MVLTNKRQLMLPFLLLAFATICYATTVPTYFLSDDFYLIGRVAEEGMFTFWRSAQGGFFRPVTVLFYLFDHRLWTLDPVGYHLTNILFHGLTACGLFFLTRQLFQVFALPRNDLLAFFAACLFVALPSHSESVSWIAGRTDVIATAFGLASTLCFVLLFDRRSVILGALSLLLLSAGLLAKESITVLPAIWLVLISGYRLSTRKSPSRHAIILLIASFFSLAAYFVVRKSVIGHFVGGYGTEFHLGLLHSHSLDNLVHYIFRTFVPPLPLGTHDLLRLPEFLIALGLALGVLSTVLLVHLRRFHSVHWSLVSVLGMCYFLGLAPALVMRISTFDTRNERFLYLPSVFACILLVYLLAALFRHQRTRALLLALFIILETAALQWVNGRWIIASQLTRQIASEVSLTDPIETIILNVPDNYRGAYVFHNGLTEAATIFLGIPRRFPYRIVYTHDLNSLWQVCDTHCDSVSVTLVFPQELRTYEIYSYGLRAQENGNRRVITNFAGLAPEVKAFVHFRMGAAKPALSTIRLKATTETHLQRTESQRGNIVQ
jgi:hypothetical protein